MGLAGAKLPQRDPRDLAPPGCYLTDGCRLVWVLESDHSGALAEDVVTDSLVSIEPVELMQHWWRIRPLATAEAGL